MLVASSEKYLSFDRLLLIYLLQQVKKYISESGSVVILMSFGGIQNVPEAKSKVIHKFLCAGRHVLEVDTD